MREQLTRILNWEINDTAKEFNRANYQQIYQTANTLIQRSIKTPDIQLNILACIELAKICFSLDSREYLLLDSKPEVPREIYIETYFNLGTLLKMTVEELIRTRQADLNRNNANRETSDSELVLSNFEQSIFDKSLNCFMAILAIDFENEKALQQITSIYTHLVLFNQHDLPKCVSLLTQALVFSPESALLHYNLGYIQQRLNDLATSITHYKTSLALVKLVEPLDTKTVVNNYNGISSVYRSIKQWPQSLHYLLKAQKIMPEDPDINNQLAVVYTEMRRTDLAEKCYKTAIANYQKTFISTDPTFLLCELYLNYGHLHSYNGDNNKSIECYNKALEVCPRFALPFQNKMMNLTYVFDQLKNKMYIAKQHRLINGLYEPLKREFKRNYTFYRGVSKSKIKIGIISGDFMEHPVSFFISPFLKRFDQTRFEVTCYSECIIDTKLFNSELKFKTIRGMSAGQAADLIYNDQIDILLDLAGHTAFNRLDVFALKPSPIQITYIGYPFTTGLNEMDYRITDAYCDGDLTVSQKFYSEKLINIRDCFLCYDPSPSGNTPFVYPKLNTTPFIKNGYITIGCFNRLNKITDPVISQFNQILLRFLTVRFVFKTKALINLSIRAEFVEKFDESVRNRITVLDCTLTHAQHLLTYNEVDIAIDTFPYSGTTTSCEALLMGVPVMSMRDTVYWFHPQNVTCSILENSGLSDWIYETEDQLFNRIAELHSKEEIFWKQLKTRTRMQFTTGKVCDQTNYIKNIQELFTGLYEKI